MKLYKSSAWLARQVKVGLTNEEIAAKCGSSAETIRLYINKFGIRR